jgi:hypothetical protein
MRDAEVLGIPRHVKSGFQEPAHYVVYLFLSFVLLDNIKNPKLFFITRRKLNYYKLSIVFFMIVTFSMSGYVVFAVYWITKSALNFKDFLISLALMRGKIVVQTSFKSILIIVFLLILVSSSFNYVLSSYQNLVRERFLKISDVIGNYNMSGSEASRVNSFFILFKYWNDEGFSGMLVGEGYANYREWLVTNFGQLDRARVSFARGHINNIIGVIGISTGIVGLILFLIFNYSFIYNHKLRNGFLFMISLFLVYFIYDFLIGYLMWALINMYIIINSNTQKILVYKPEE